jgi:chromosomal replication initiator protein
MPELRQIYRGVDLLAIDNLELFAHKHATQEELFHTFNELHTANIPILLSSRLPPAQLQAIESRLLSRFEWGISLKLESIDPITLLSHKSALWGLAYSRELLEFLAKTFPSRPLLAMQALAIRAPSTPSPTLEIARSLLQDWILQEESDHLSPEKIVQAVAQHFGILSKDLIGKSQTKEFSYPRQAAMYLCRELLHLTYSAIAKIFDRDHSTVIESVQKIQREEESKRRELLGLVVSRR